MFDGKTVLITGAAGGIGASMARLLRQRDARLVLIDADEAGLLTVARQLGAESIVCVTCDVTDYAAMRSAVETGVARFGAIDVVVANAGIQHWAPVLTVEPSAFRRVIETNLIGTFNAIHATLPSIVERRGYVLVVSSVSAYAAVPGMAAYAASKAGAEHLATALHHEVASLGVGVGSAHMSLVDTKMFRETSQSEGFITLQAKMPAVLRRTVSAEKCAERLVQGIARRKRHVDVPRWVAAARWLKPILATRSSLGPTRFTRER